MALSHDLRLADARINATTIEHKATLLTANVQHFGTVEGRVIGAFEP